MSLKIETFKLRKILKRNLNQKKGHPKKLLGTRFHVGTYFGQVARLNQKIFKNHAFSAITSKFQKVKTGSLVDKFPMKGTTTAQSTSFRLPKILLVTKFWFQNYFGKEVIENHIFLKKLQFFKEPKMLGPSY